MYTLRRLHCICQVVWCIILNPFSKHILLFVQNSQIDLSKKGSRPPNIAAIGKAKNWHRHWVIRIAAKMPQLPNVSFICNCLQTSFFNSIVFRNQGRSFFFKIIIFTQVVSQESQSSTFLTTSGILLNSQ